MFRERQTKALPGVMPANKVSPDTHYKGLVVLNQRFKKLLQKLPVSSYIFNFKPSSKILLVKKNPLPATCLNYRSQQTGRQCFNHFSNFVSPAYVFIAGTTGCSMYKSNINCLL
jgi:hypothetical protein